MLATLRMSLQTFMAANVANFANIRDKKRLRALVDPGAAQSGRVPPNMKKAGNFPA